MRLDKYLTDAGLCPTRSRAERYIRAGLVTVNGNPVTKCGAEVPDGASVILATDGERYVSRGGCKLEHALDTFGVSPEGLVCLDVGASSGGFTDCLLQRGASRVFALDNGRGQLDPKIANDPRVLSLEERNARYMRKEDFQTPIDLVTMDVSFISQTLILPAVYTVLSSGGTLISLVKPQFEVGRGAIGKGGIVKDTEARERALKSVLDKAKEIGFECLGTTVSPIAGGDGNTEYLAYFRKGGNNRG